MFTGLGHDAVVSSDHKKNEIDAGRPCHHVFYETLMPWDVYNRDTVLKLRETQVDGYLSGFFFRELVGVCAGERLYECGLAMVYMARCADYALRHRSLLVRRGELQPTN